MSGRVMGVTASAEVMGVTASAEVMEASWGEEASWGALTVEIFPKRRPFWPNLREYLDSQRVR